MKRARTSPEEKRIEHVVGVRAIYVDPKRSQRRKGVAHPNGTAYGGYIKDNKPNGKGKITYPDGTVYEGDINDGETNGRGKIKYTNVSL